jgi:hypothetical protein
MNPYALALVFAIGFGGAWQIQDWRSNSEQLIALKDAQNTAEKTATKIESAAALYAASAASSTIEYRTLTKVVNHVIEKPIYRNVCFDTDGMRALSAAIAGSGAASAISPALPTPK